MKKKDDSKITKIQDAVVDILLTEGTASVSTIKVAKLVGIAQSNVYLYFANKNELLISVYRRELQRIREFSNIEKITDQSIDITDRIDIYLKSIYEYSLEYPDSLTIIEQIKALNLVEEDLYVANNIVSAMLTDAIAEGYLKNLPVSLHMSVVFNVMHRHALNIKDGLYDKDKYNFSEISQLVLDAIKKD